MMKSMACAAIVALAVLAPAVQADTPSFNFVQLGAQHVNGSAIDGWGWGAAASFNPAGGWFVAASYRRANHVAATGASLHAWHADAGYKVDLLDTLAAYGEAGWSKRTLAGLAEDSGMHYEVGLRARLPLLQLEGAVGRYQRNGGFDEYKASALFHVFAFTYVSVGYVSDHYAHGDIGRWQAGLRLTF